MFFTVKALIDQEVRNGIPSHRIILGGFSQVSVACAQMMRYITQFSVLLWITAYVQNVFKYHVRAKQQFNVYILNPLSELDEKIKTILMCVH